MSRATLYAFPAAGPCVQVAEYPNAWGGAARVWTAVSGKYLGDQYAWRNGDAAGGLWKLARDLRVPREHRLVLAATYDRALVERENLQEMADLFRKFREDFPVAGADHLAAWAADLDCLSGDHGLPFFLKAVGWQATSVARELWWIPEENRAYDLALDRGHWFVFQECP